MSSVGRARPEGILSLNPPSNKSASQAKSGTRLIASQINNFGHISENLGHKTTELAPHFQEVSLVHKSNSLKDKNLQQKKPGFLSWVAAKALRIAGKTGDFAIFSFTDLDKKINEGNKQLAKISGGPEFGQLLSIIGPRIAQDILVPKIKNAAASKVGDTIGGMVEGYLAGVDSLSLAFQAVLPQVVVNIAQKMKEQSKKDDISITPVSVMSFIFTKINDDLQRAGLELEEFKKSLIGKRCSDKALNALVNSKKKESIQKLRNELMNLLFPNGSNDIPLSRVILGARSYIWNQLNSGIEQLLYTLADSSKMQDTLKNAPESIVSESEGIAEAAVNFGKAYLSSSQEVADKIVGGAQAVNEMDEEEQTKFNDYLCLQIEEFGKANHAGIRSAWKMVRGAIESITAHIFVSHSKNKKNDETHVVALVKQLLTALSDFVHKNQSDINKCANELQKRKLSHDQIKENKLYIAKFKPLAQSFKDIAAFNRLPNPPRSFLEMFSEEIPILAARHFKEFLEPFVKHWHITPAEAMHNRQVHLNRIEHALNTRSQGDISNQKIALRAIDSLTKLGAEQLVKVIKDVQFSKQDSSKKAAPKMRLDNVNSDFEVTQMQKQWEGLRDFISDFMLQLLANRLESLPLEQPINHSLVTELVEKLLSSLFIFSPSEIEGIEAAKKINSSGLRQKAIQKVFEERASELISLLQPFAPTQEQVGPYAPPLPAVANKLLWNYIETSFLPNFLMKVYSEKIAGQLIAAEAATNMQQITHSNLREEVCDLLAGFVSKFAPTFAKRDREFIAEDMYMMISKNLTEAGQNADAQSVGKYFNENKKQISKEISLALSATSGALNTVQPMVKDTIKTVLIQAFSAFTKRIDSFEHPIGEKFEQDFLVKQGIRLMNLTKEHFQALNQVAKKHNKSAFYELEHDILLKELAGSKVMHAGVPKSKEALDAQKRIKKALIELKKARLELVNKKKFGNLMAGSIEVLKNKIKEQRYILRRAQKIVDRERFENFFQPFTKDLLGLAGMTNADSIPFPSPLKEALWGKLQNEILPSVLMEVFQTALEPQSLNQMIITTLENLNAPGDSEEENNAIPKDPIQKEINVACGELFQQIVQMIPHSIIKVAFKIDKIKSTSAEIIGQSIRKQLGEKLSLQKIIDNAMPSLVQSLHGGVLMVEDASGKLVPLKKNESVIGKKVKIVPGHLGSDGQLVESTRKDDFSIPEDDEAFEVEALKKMNAEDAAMRKAKADMEATINSKIADLFLFGPLKSAFKKFIKLWNKAVEKVFGKYANQVKEFFNYLPFRILYVLIEAGLIVATAPPIFAAWLAVRILRKIFLWDRHVSNKVDNILKGMHMPIHEDLLYKAAQDLVQSLKGDLHVKDTEDLIKKLVQEHELRRTQDADEETEYLA